MLQLPPRFATIILSFAPRFFQRTWRHAEGLVLGAVLAPGTRTVASLLRITGLAQERHFVNYHRVLNRAIGSPRAAGGILLRLPACCMDRKCGRTHPRPILGQVRRAEIGRPSSNIRFRT
jgi:hypothetical protein